MKPFGLHGLRVAGLLLPMLYTARATDTALTATVLYDVKASCTGKVAPAVLVTAELDSNPAACAESVTCDAVDEVFPATYCPTTDGTIESTADGDFYYSFLADVFGSAPTVTVETYQASQSCDLTKLTDFTAYVADGECHKTGAMESYIAVNELYGSAVKTFTAADDCTGVSTTLVVTKDELDANSCAGNLVDKKVYRSGLTTVFLSSAVSYDTEDGDCKPAAVPIQIVSEVVDASCTSALTCSGAGVPYTSTLCSTSLTFFQFYQESFGTNQPVVYLREFAAGKSCAATDFSGITTYLADKKCHKTGAATSFRATRTVDGAVTIKTYNSADCSGTAADELDWNVAKATGNACADGTDGIADTLVYGSGATPLYLQLTATYSENTAACTSPGIPVLLESTTVDVDVCEATDECTTADTLFEGTACSSTLSIQADIGGVFGDTPYVMVQEFTAGEECATAELTDITAYLADGKCHKTGSATSYVATRAETGAATVTTYTDAVCTSGSVELTVTADQAGTNSCANDANGVLDKLIYGGGFTPLYLKATATFENNDDNCASPGVPTYIDTTLVEPETCTTSDACSNAEDLFEGTLCTSTAAFKDDADTVFGSTPYIVVETYTASKDCAVTSLTGSKTYVADAKCHATAGDASFLATRSESGEMTITFYSDATCETKDGDSLVVTDGDAGSCSSDQIVYGVGASPTVKSTVLSFDDNACTTPAQLVVSNEFTCSASTACTETDSHFLKHDCSDDHFDAAATMFGQSPYVVIELYKDDECATLDGVQVYSSDKECHVAIDGTSFKSTLADNGSGDVVLYEDDECTENGMRTIALSPEILDDNSCTDGAKYYAFNGPLPPNSTPATPSTTTKTPSSTTKTPATPSTTTATPSSTTEAPTTTSTGSGTSDAASLFPVMTASLGLLGAALGLLF